MKHPHTFPTPASGGSPARLARRSLRAPRGRLWRCTAVALAAGAFSIGAQAVIGAPTILGPSGDMENISYGSGGNVFQLLPQIFVQGLGNGGSPASVLALNPELQFSFAVNGVGTGLMTVDYVVSNVSVGSSFEQLRFMLYTNPDGDPAQYLDRMSANWGPAAPGDAVLREVRAYTANPFDSILSRFQFNNTLTEGVNALDAACTAASGCDATTGMQWNAPMLMPGESFLVRIGLSDNGQSVSSRWIDADALVSPATSLRLSGFSQVTAVPEPSAAALLLAGVAVLAQLARRRRGR